MNEKTETETDIGPYGPPMSSERYERAYIARKHRDLSQHPEMQAEAIADHYLSHVSQARDIGDMIYIIRHGGDTRTARRTLELMVKRLKADHAHELGIELSWSAPDNQK